VPRSSRSHRDERELEAGRFLGSYFVYESLCPIHRGSIAMSGRLGDMTPPGLRPVTVYLTSCRPERREGSAVVPPLALANSRIRGHSPAPHHPRVVILKRSEGSAVVFPNFRVRGDRLGSHQYRIGMQFGFNEQRGKCVSTAYRGRNTPERGPSTRACDRILFVQVVAQWP
jgi:hypothetical protein